MRKKVISGGVMSDKQGRRRLLYSLCPLWCILFLFCSCDRRELTYYTEAEFEIRTDWSGSRLDDEEAGNGATAVFYPRDGGEPTIILMGDRSYGKVRLRVGCYDALVFNRSFSEFGSIDFRGDRYGELEAYAHHIETRIDPVTRSETRVIVGSPEKIAADGVEEIEVTEDMLGNYSPSVQARNRSVSGADDDFTLTFAPQCLTHEIKVVVNVIGLNNIRSAVGVLVGVAESVNLSTGRVAGETVTQQFALDEKEFTAGSPFSGTLTGRFNTFGFEAGVTRKLTLKALLVDSKTRIEETFDVTAREEEAEDGTLVLYIEVDASPIADVKPEGGSGSGFDADVEDWGDEAEHDIPL